MLNKESGPLWAKLNVDLKQIQLKNLKTGADVCPKSSTQGIDFSVVAIEVGKAGMTLAPSSTLNLIRVSTGVVWMMGPRGSNEEISAGEAVYVRPNVPVEIWTARAILVVTIMGPQWRMMQGIQVFG